MASNFAHHVDFHHSSGSSTRASSMSPQQPAKSNEPGNEMGMARMAFPLIHTTLAADIEKLSEASDEMDLELRSSSTHSDDISFWSEMINVSALEAAQGISVPMRPLLDFPLSRNEKMMRVIDLAMKLEADQEEELQCQQAVNRRLAEYFDRAQVGAAEADERASKAMEHAREVDKWCHRLKRKVATLETEVSELKKQQVDLEMTLNRAINQKVDTLMEVERLQTIIFHLKQSF